MSRRMRLGLRTLTCPRNTAGILFSGIGLPRLKRTSQGGVICLRIFSQVVVVLCSVSAIKDLLEKRGEIYSDRPHLPITEMFVFVAFFSFHDEPPMLIILDSLVRISIGPCSLPE